jgi:hypothetical protein
VTALRIVTSGAPVRPQGHRRYLGTGTVRVVDNTEDALRRRARWNLYADCDRAPLGWERRA